MERRSALTDVDVASWLSAPAAAPAFDVVARAMERTHSARQRPRWLAVALGAPTDAPRPGTLAPSRRIGLVIVATALLLAIVGLAVGSSRNDQRARPTNLASEPVVSPIASPRPQSTPRPTPASSEVPRGPVVNMVALDRLGLYLPVSDGSSIDQRADRVTADGYLVTVGTRSRGADVDAGPGRPTTRVWGTDVDAVVSRIAAIPNVSIEVIGQVEIDSEVGRLVWMTSVPAANAGGGPLRWPLAIVHHKGRLYLVRPIASLLGALPVDEALRAFVEQFDWIDPTTFHGIGLSITMPDSWQISMKGSTTIVRRTPSVLFGAEFEIDSYALGSRIQIPRGYQVDAVTISGRNLGELRASIEAVLPGAADGRAAIRVDGVKGFRFVVPEATVIQPLAALAVLVVGDRIVVITYGLSLDGPPQLDEFDRVLDGLRFD